MGEFRQKVYELNKGGMLRAHLKFDQIAPVLQQLDTQIVLDILQNLEDKAASVVDPTAYVIAAARKENAAQGGNAENDFDQKLRKRVGWLNNNVAFQSPLMYCEVSSPLRRLGHREAFAILKELE